MNEDPIIVRVTVDRTNFPTLQAPGSTTFGTLRVMGGIPGPRGISELALSFPIELYVGQVPQPLPLTSDMHISRMRLAVAKEYPPVGSDLILDVLKNGVSITPINKPTILDGETLSASIIPSDTESVAGDVLTVDILQVGSTQPGSYATLVLEVVQKGA
jgi:hypothetical protein